MRTKHLFTAAIIVAMGLSACSKDNESNELGQEVKISTSINGIVDGAQTRATIDPATGAGKLENGDVISLEAFNASGGTVIEYTIGTTKVYWDELISANGNPPFNFVAIFPYYMSSGGTREQMKFNIAKISNPDILAAKHAGVNKGETVSLAFNHLMHKLIINLTSNVYTAAELALANVALKNLASISVINGTDAIVALNNGKPISEGTDAYAGKTGSKVNFIVAPQVLPTAGTDFVEFTIQGKKFVYKIPSNLSVLESGKILTLNLSVNRDQVSLVSQDISQWGTQTTISEELPFN